MPDLAHRMLHYTLFAFAFAFMGVLSLIVMDCVARIFLSTGIFP